MNAYDLCAACSHRAVDHHATRPFPCCRNSCDCAALEGSPTVAAAIDRLTAAVYVLAATTFWEQSPARNDDEWDDVRRDVAAIATELRKAVES